jgi:hypothetical protein
MIPHHYRTQLVCAQKTLSKSFAECHPRQSSLGLNLDGKQLFAECFLSGTRQLPSAESTHGKKKHSTKFEPKK